MKKEKKNGICLCWCMVPSAACCGDRSCTHHQGSRPLSGSGRSLRYLDLRNCLRPQPCCCARQRNVRIDHQPRGYVYHAVLLPAGLSGIRHQRLRRRSGLWPLGKKGDQVPPSGLSAHRSAGLPDFCGRLLQCPHRRLRHEARYGPAPDQPSQAGLSDRLYLRPHLHPDPHFHLGRCRGRLHGGHRGFLFRHLRFSGHGPL